MSLHPNSIHTLKITGPSRRLCITTNLIMKSVCIHENNISIFNNKNCASLINKKTTINQQHNAFLFWTPSCQSSVAVPLSFLSINVSLFHVKMNTRQTPCIPAHVIRPQTIVLVTNRVPVARFGPKLRQNESYGPQEPFKTPPAPPWARFRPKISTTTTKKPNSRSFPPHSGQGHRLFLPPAGERLGAERGHAEEWGAGLPVGALR